MVDENITSRIVSAAKLLGTKDRRGGPSPRYYYRNLKFATWTVPSFSVTTN